MRLPVELEPEYSEGFTCDRCGEEFIQGSFYHQEQSGTDFCIPCGAEQGLTPFNGLVASLFFTNDGSTLQNFETLSFVIFGFRIDKTTCGLFFDNKSNLIFKSSEDGAFNKALLIENNKGTIVKKKIEIEAWNSRYSWVDLKITRKLPVEVLLHPSPTETIPFGEVYIKNFSATPKGFTLNLDNGWEQLFDVDTGTEIVRKHDHTVMSMINYSPLVNSPGKKVRKDLNSYSNSV